MPEFQNTLTLFEETRENIHSIHPILLSADFPELSAIGCWR